MQDPKGSFSLSSCEPNTKLRFFFDDDEESYFDLNLEAMPESKEFEFQISFPSQPVSGFSSQIPADQLFKNGRILPVENFDVVEVDGSSVSNNETPTVSQDDSSLLGNLTAGRDSEASPVIVDRSYDAGNKKDQELMGSRKPSKMMAVLNNGVMKLLIKFPSEKIRSTFMSIIRSYHYLPHKELGNTSRTRQLSRKHRRLNKPFYKWFSLGRNNIGSGNTSYNTSNGKQLEVAKRSSTLEEKVDTIRGILDALNLSSGSKGKEVRSCPGSFQSSPSHYKSGYTEKGAMERDSSIGSAIAHCKLSFGDVGCFR